MHKGDPEALSGPLQHDNIDNNTSDAELTITDISDGSWGTLPEQVDSDPKSEADEQESHLRTVLATPVPY